ncbi:neuromedin-U isoform X3 [Pseudophryne corroboree]|uniref:neuromedin-U isoform X3 n=1 Tax=Pseudophryne corroboree TaxID=495146 RepID=UPI003081E4B9
MMLSSSSCKRQHPIQHHASEDRDQSRHHQYTFRGQTPCGLLLLIILVSWTGICQGAPFSSNMLRAEQELQLWNGIDDVCSAVLSDSQPAVSSGLEEICFMVMGYLQKSQGSDEKDDSKRFLFHYSKSLDSGKSDITGVYKGPGFFSSRSASFQYKPRNGRRSSAFR